MTYGANLFTFPDSEHRDIPLPKDSEGNKDKKCLPPLFGVELLHSRLMKIISL